MRRSLASRHPKRPYASVVRWRKASGLTQVEAGKLFGISNTHWCNIEAGIRHPGRELALRISEHTNVPLETILQTKKIA